MIRYSSSLLPPLLPLPPKCSSIQTPRVKFSLRSDSYPGRVDTNASQTATNDQSLSLGCGSCSCGRRRLFMEVAAATALFPICSTNASSDTLSDYGSVLNRVHPPRPDWYEEFYASVLDTSMKSYEEEIAGYKTELFANLKGKAGKVLEIGIGTGPNLRYYAGNNDLQVVGVDPNRKMERYAKAAAVAAGLPLPNFKFIQAVGEAIPLDDASVDAIVGTLVLCSVKDVNMALKEVKRVLRPGGLYLFVEHVAAKDGTTLRFIQSVIDPLQQTVSDGCHLTRETGKYIFEAGFSHLHLRMASLSNASLISPHVYGIASVEIKIRLVPISYVKDPRRQIEPDNYKCFIPGSNTLRKPNC